MNGHVATLLCKINEEEEENYLKKIHSTLFDMKHAWLKKNER